MNNDPPKPAGTSTDPMRPAAREAAARRLDDPLLHPSIFGLDFELPQEPAAIPSAEPAPTLHLSVIGLKPMERELLQGLVKVSQRRSPRLVILEDSQAGGADVVMIDARDAQAMTCGPANGPGWPSARSSGYRRHRGQARAYIGAPTGPVADPPDDAGTRARIQVRRGPPVLCRRSVRACGGPPRRAFGARATDPGRRRQPGGSGAPSLIAGGERLRSDRCRQRRGGACVPGPAQIRLRADGRDDAGPRRLRGLPGDQGAPARVRPGPGGHVRPASPPRSTGCAARWPAATPISRNPSNRST